jgi:TatD DNase family protein
MARELWKMGWYVGFDGPLTYKNAKKVVEVAKEAPMDKILFETDAPYMAPVPVRGTRNDSRNLVHLVRTLASLRGMSEEEVAAQTMENGKRLFGIK